MATRTRRYSPRPERVAIDWPSCWRIAFAVMVLSFFTSLALWVVFMVLGVGMAAVFG